MFKFNGYEYEPLYTYKGKLLNISEFLKLKAPDLIDIIAENKEKEHIDFFRYGPNFHLRDLCEGFHRHCENLFKQIDKDYKFKRFNLNYGNHFNIKPEVWNKYMKCDDQTGFKLIKDKIDPKDEFIVYNAPKQYEVVIGIDIREKPKGI